jgi:hypothetical protein
MKVIGIHKKEGLALKIKELDQEMKYSLNLKQEVKWG